MKGEWMIGLVAPGNYSDETIEGVMKYTGCYGTAEDECDMVGGIWKGHNGTVPGNRLGCFDPIIATCLCSDSMCSREACSTDSNMIWWSDCLNCQCSRASDTILVIDEASETTTGTSESDPSSGGEDTGIDTGTGADTSTGDVETSFGNPGSGSFGCYDINVNSCNCDASVCTQASCSSSGVSEWTEK
jgi:hypothetical protein